ncbi:phosphorylase family protein [Streptomyces sp. NBC_00459]|uniref:phosphorylase family protein n=1 Tax=Streptomyces sp. NBC_00459 TaxID=2975749 RepID=UPI002E192F59
MLYAGAREGRLIWRDARGFALLEAPLLSRHRPLDGGFRSAALRLADRHWDLLVFTVPLFLLMTTALGLLPFPSAGSAVLLLALAAIVYVAVWLTSLAVMSVVWLWHTFSAFARAPGEVAESLSGVHWTVSLCHEEEAERADELLRRATGRLGQLVALRAGAASADLGYRVSRGELTETLVLVRRGITTDAVRSHVDAWDSAVGPRDDGVEVVMIQPTSRAPDPADRRVVTGRFLLLYLAAILVMVPAEALIVMGQEAAACSNSECEGRPTTYPDALRWLSQRLLLTDPPDLSPATGAATAIGWLTGLMALMVIPVAYVAGRNQIRAHTIKVEPYRRMRSLMEKRTRLLILVVTSGERDAVFRAVAEINGKKPTAQFLGDRTVFDLGVVSEVEIHLVQSEQAAGGPAGAALVTSSVIDRLTPDFLVMVGICCGLRPQEQTLGDIVVSSQLRLMDHRKVADRQGGDPLVILRGDKVTPSGLLLDRLRAAEVDWPGAPVHYGLMLSSSVLIDSVSVRDQLVALEPDGRGAEMEGGGVYAAAAKGRTDWILVKAISDWGIGKNDDAQPLAARNAAEFVVHMIRGGALDRRTWHTSAASGPSE